MGYTQGHPSEEHGMERNRKRSSYTEETWQTQPLPGAQGACILTGRVMVTVCAFNLMWWEWDLTSVVFPTKSITTFLTVKNTWQIPTEKHTAKYLANALQNCQDQQGQSLSNHQVQKILRIHGNSLKCDIWSATPKPQRARALGKK